MGPVEGQVELGRAPAEEDGRGNGREGTGDKVGRELGDGRHAVEDTARIMAAIMALLPNAAPATEVT